MGSPKLGTAYTLVKQFFLYSFLTKMEMGWIGVLASKDLQILVILLEYIIWVVIFGSLSSKIQRKGIPSPKPIPTMKRLSKSSSNPLPKKKSTAPQKPQKTAKTIHQLSTTLHKYHLSQKKGINAPAENHLQRPRTGPWPSAGRTSSRSETARAPDGSESSDSG